MKTLIEIYQTVINQTIEKEPNSSFNYFNNMGTVNSYLPVLSNILNPIRNEKITMLSLGFGNGLEAKIWTEYFSDVQITGIEKSKYLNLETDLPNVKVLIGDIFSEQTFNLLDSTFSLIFYDIPGNYIQFTTAIKMYSKLLADQGMLIIKNVYDIDINKDNYKTLVESNGLTFEVYDLRDIKGRYDDVLIVCRKPYS